MGSKKSITRVCSLKKTDHVIMPFWFLLFYFVNYEGKFPHPNPDISSKNSNKGKTPYIVS